MTRCRTFLLALAATLAACQSARVDIAELNAEYRDYAYLWTIERNREQHRQLQSALAQDSRAMLWHHNCSIGDARITAPIPTVQLSKAELARVKEILHRAEPCTSPYRPNVVPDSYEHYSLDNQGEVIATGSFPASDLTYKVPPTFLLTFYSRDSKVHPYDLHLCRIRRKSEAAAPEHALDELQLPDTDFDALFSLPSFRGFVSHLPDEWQARFCTRK
jgi:hypothetical protein